MKHKNNISASEINKYLYCNYSWYYGRKYGALELRRRKKSYLQEMGIKPNLSEDNFLQRGLRFHARFERKRQLKRALCFAALLVTVGFLIYLVLLS